MAQDEIAALKHALRKQLLLLKRLSTELEEEREASASGADEALTMISRLQKEKAEERMEAWQYKQMAEAKLLHADHSLEMLEQVIRHKDAEIASLKNEAQVYKKILLNRGVDSADITELHGLRVSNNDFMGTTSSCIRVRRQASMPSIRFTKVCSEMAINEGDDSLLPALCAIWSEIGDNPQVQEVNTSSEYNDGSSSSCVDSGIGKMIQRVSSRHKAEIPKSSSGFLLPKSSKTVLKETHLEAEQMIGISEPMPKESRLRKWTSMNHRPSLSEPRDQNFLSQSDIEQLKCQIQQLADDVRILKEDDLKRGKEQIMLLNKIYEQLKPVQSQIRASKSNKSSPQDEALFVSLTEAMLSFSI